MSRRCAADSPVAASPAACVVLVGFARWEVPWVKSVLEDGLGASSARVLLADGNDASSTDALDLVGVLDGLADGGVAPTEGEALPEGTEVPTHPGARVVLCGPGVADAVAGQIASAILGAGLQPCIAARCLRDRHAGLSARDVAARVAREYGRHWGVLPEPLVGSESPSPSAVECPLHVAMDERGHKRVSVLDGLVAEEERAALMRWLTSGRPTGGEEESWGQGEGGAEGEDEDKDEDPEAGRWARWEKTTADFAGGPTTWGLSGASLEALAEGDLPDDVVDAISQVEQRLAALLSPRWAVCRMPGGVLEGLMPFVANAAHHGDAFAYHVDADPAGFDWAEAEPWVASQGDYANGTPGRPRFASLVLYLCDDWDPAWGGETFFLSPDADAGIFVLPRAGRGVLMDADVVHRVGAPSALLLPESGRDARYSFVWKLILMPNEHGSHADYTATPKDDEDNEDQVVVDDNQHDEDPLGVPLTFGAHVASRQRTL